MYFLFTGRWAYNWGEGLSYIRAGLYLGVFFCLQVDWPITGVKAYELGREGGS